MAEALAEARAAKEAGEVPVGALLLSGHGDVLARAGNAMERRRDPTAHAEMLVLRQGAEAAGNQRLEGCVLAVTLEPCLMCASAAVHARLAGVVYGAADPAAGAAASALEAFDLPFLNHRVWHMGGVLEEACAALLRGFFKTRRERV